MRRRSLVPLLLLTVLLLAAAVWLVLRTDDGGGDGGLITRAPEEGPEKPPMLRGAPDAKDPAEATPGSAGRGARPANGGISGLTPGKGRFVGSSTKNDPFRITGTTRDANTGDVRVRVVDERGDPRAGTHVRISVQGDDGQFSVEHEALLDGTGETVFEGVRPGRAYVWLHADGARHFLRIRVEGGRVTEVDTVFPVGVVLEGVVRHEEKGNLAGISVKIEQGRHGSDGYFSGTTDENGQYRIAGVPKGTYEVSLTGRTIGYNPRAKAQLVVEEERGVVHHDFVLGLVAIRGAVRDAVSGRPIPEVKIDIGGLYAPGATDAAGLYAYVDIPPGSYRLFFRKEGYARGMTGEIEVVEGRVTTVDMELTRASCVVVHLRTPDGDPVPGVGRLEYHAVGGSSGVTGSGRITADERGVARYEEIVPGTYEFSVVLDGYTSARAKADVGSGETSVTIVCTPKAPDETVALRGVIRDAVGREPIGGVHVSPYAGSEVVVSDAEGRYAFRKLRPGTHRFWVTKDGYGIYLLRGVEVKADETTVRDIELQPAGTLRLVLTDSRGDPVVGDVTLGIHPKSGTTGTRVGTGVQADAAGHAVYRRIVPGAYEFNVIKDGVGRGRAEADVGLGETTVYVRLE